MKFKKKFALILAFCWIFGLAGGYFIGVESASIPNESIDYNYFSSEYSESSVKTVDHGVDEDNTNDNVYTALLTRLHLEELSKKSFRSLFSTGN